jgi:DNA-binding response OmpR family regulator
MASGGHVLIIEDEMLIGIDVLNCLATLGFDTFAFASAETQALEQARLQRPDLVTVDVGLLDGDGLSAAHALTREFGEMPFIYITGDPRKVQDVGGAVVVEKPFRHADLEAACHRLGLH